jgi:hypothetical protein
MKYWTLKLSDRLISDETPHYHYYIFGFITAFFILFYIHYAFTAWFIQDDIGLLHLFRENPQWLKLFSFGTLYRFLSINLYWHYLYKFFGDTAALYFIFNLLTLCANAIILFYFIRGLSESRTIALIAALIYFIMPPTIKNMTWICNNQHLFSHFFAFLFLHIYFNKGGVSGFNIEKGVILSLLLFFTLISNFLAAFIIPSIIFYHILYFKEIKLKKINVIFFVFWGISFAAFVLASKYFTEMLNTPEYGIDISISTFFKTLQSYSYHIYKNVPILVITIVLIFIVGILKKDKLIIYFITSSLLFYAPFAFAVFQRNANYIAISYLFYCTGIILILKKYVRMPFLILLFVLYNFINTHHMVREFSENPAGERVRAFISKMKDEFIINDLEKYKRIYFKTDEPINYKSGIAAIDKRDTPVFWGRLANGRALKLFLDPTIDYRVVKYDETAPKGFPLVIVSKDLYSRNDIGVKKVIMPK